jgi:hypothetical protein
MSPFQNNPEFYDRPIRLTEQQKEQPLEVIRSFFQNCHLHELRRVLWKMLETSLTVRNSVYDDATERSQLLWFYRELETMLEASFLLCEMTAFQDPDAAFNQTGTGVQPGWKTKAILEDEIRNLRIKNAEQENELLELRYFKKHGKPFKPQ